MGNALSIRFRAALHSNVEELLSTDQFLSASGSLRTTPSPGAGRPAGGVKRFRQGSAKHASVEMRQGNILRIPQRLMLACSTYTRTG